jgi:hypothetical protein
MEGNPAIDPRQVGRNVVMTAAIAGLALGGAQEVFEARVAHS